MSPLPPLWLLTRARELRKRGVSVYEAPSLFVREARRRIESGDMETAAWEASEMADYGMAVVLSIWIGGINGNAEAIEQ